MLLLSGHAADQLDWEEGLPAGTAFLAKPFGLQPLAEAVAELLGEKAAA